MFLRSGEASKVVYTYNKLGIGVDDIEVSKFNIMKSLIMKILSGMV